MTHEETLIATLAIALALAFVLGMLAARLRMPPLVGYLLAGVALGPHTPGFVADAHLAPQLAEVGVMLLMFGVGTHFSLRDLLAVKNIAVPGALAQILVATALGAGVAHLWGWRLGAGLVFGLALSVASTVVLLRALEERGALESSDGRIAVGWLVVEDLVTVLALVLLPALAGLLGGATPAARALGGGNLWAALGLTLGKVALFVTLMLVLGTRLFPWVLARVARTNSRELFTLAAIALALGVAYGAAQLFDVSVALGAFFAGMVI
jgi:monovalent cation:H+ antiporter-2, CPA2 family